MTCSIHGWSTVRPVVECLPCMWGQQTRQLEQSHRVFVYLIVFSFYCTVYYILKKQEIATSEEMVALSCQGVIFLGAYNWLIPKKALSSIKTSSVLLRKHMLWFLKCVIDLSYQLLIWKRNFILHSYEERHRGKFLQPPFPLVMHILRTLE